MTEGTYRQPHERHYTNDLGQKVHIVVDDHGTVQISEELLDSLLTATGMVEDHD